MSFQPPGGPPPPPPPGGPPPPGNPYPPQGYPGPQQPWPQQQPWAGGPPPKERGNGWKWGLGALAVLVVIGVTAAVTISVTKGGDDDGAAPTGETFGLASADDKGPANIITEDPSCAAWGPISQSFVETQKKNGWVDRDAAIPATDWTSQQRAQYDEIRVAARNVADQSVQLAKLTPHRVMRELYEAYIAYARAYSDAIPTYTAQDNHLAGVMNSAGSVITYVCAAITYKSAQSRSPLEEAASPPTVFAPLANPESPHQFLSDGDSTCAEWIPLLERYIDDTRPWQAIDSAIPASDWSAQQRAVIDDTTSVMERYADDIEELGRSSSNPVIQDLATFSSQYRRAYAAALPTYTSADGWLDSTAQRTTSVIYEACKAAEA